MTIQEIIDGVTEQDEYRRAAEINRRIEAWAVSKLPPVADGYTRTITAVDYATGTATYVDRLTSEIEAEARAARLATFPAEKAALFRAILRKHFGDGAETNRAVTADAVTGYFATKPGITADEVRDGVLLRELFAVLTEWNGTGETWTLPWEVLP